MIEKTKRNSSIELLRIISMLGVIILHYNNENMGGGFKYVTQGSVNQLYLYLTENIFVGAVNLFIMISAYFLCKTKKRKLSKVIELIFQVIVFQVIFYFVGMRMGQVFSIKGLLLCFLPTNYFVILYSVIYIISPYFDLLIEKMEQKEFKKFLIVIFSLFSIWSFGVDCLGNVLGRSITGLSTVGAYGSQAGYSIVNFTLLYFVGAYIRIYGEKMNKKMVSCISIISLMILFITSLGEHKLGLGLTVTWNYNNPVLIIFSATILLLVVNLNFYSGIMNELAKAAFTCFLVQGFFVYKIHVESVVNSNTLVLIGHQLLISVGLYLISYICYKIYHLCIGWWIKKLFTLFDHIDISTER